MTAGVQVVEASRAIMSGATSIFYIRIDADPERMATAEAQ
jgi:hypothetical protein